MLRRNLFTGELEDTSNDQDEFINKTRPIPSGCVDPRSRPRTALWSRWRGRSLKVHPAQAKEFSEAAKEAGTGAWYDKKGVMRADSESAMQREFARRGHGDGNAGYRDAGHDHYQEVLAEARETVPAQGGFY